VGAIISDIPMVDGVDVEQIHTGDYIQVDGAQITIVS
jgi:predicted aconitase with swiveling domain